MINADSSRLLRALAISVGFHILLFLLMSIFDWFPESENLSLYEPVTVMITRSPEYTPSDRKADPQEIPADKPEPAPVAEAVPVPDIQTADTGNSGNKGETAPLSIPNAYDDLFIQEEENSPQYVPVTDPVKSDKPFVPGENRVELDSSENRINPDNRPQTEPVQAENTASVVSDSDITALEDSLADSEAADNPGSFTPPEEETAIPRFIDDKYQFDRGDVNRILVSSPLPVIPDDLTMEFPSEIEYKIRFELNQDGVVKVLSITPLPVYSSIDTSIRNALRSWIFNGSPGSEVVEGTITIIFKAK